MDEGPPHENPRHRYRDYVAKAARAHLAALQTCGVRGWITKNKSFVVLTEDEAQDCSAAAVERLIAAIDRGNEAVLQLIKEHAAESRNTYRMLRHMFKLCAYDMFGKSQFGDVHPEYEDDGGARESRFERLLQGYLEANAQADPNELFEIRKDLARITSKAIAMRRLNPTRQFILLAHLQGRDDTDIANELGLEAIQVQRHLWKIREALGEAHHALEMEH